MFTVCEACKGKNVPLVSDALMEGECTWPSWETVKERRNVKDNLTEKVAMIHVVFSENSIAGLPPGNDKIRGSLSAAEIFVPQKK